MLRTEIDDVVEKPANPQLTAGEFPKLFNFIRDPFSMWPCNHDKWKYRYFVKIKEMFIDR